MGINTDAVQRLYVAYFNRPADPIGLAYWEGQLSSTVAATQAELETIAGGFSGSAEYAALYAGQSNAQIIDNLYLNLFARNAEPAGLIYWAGQLTNGAQTFAQIALQLTYSAQGTDADAITNKLAASTSFTTELDTTPEILGYNGTAAATSARTWLATVTDVAATLTTAQAGVATAVTAAVAEGTAVTTTGTTFTLTASADTGTAFTGTANNDTYIGTLATNLGTGTTLNPGDALAGGAGTDTLNISISGTNTGAQSTTAITLTAIENISVSNFQTADGFDNTIDLSLATGVTGIAVSASASTGDTLFTGVGAIATAAMGNGAGDLSIAYTDAAVTGTADAQTLTLSGQTAGSFTVAGATTGGVETLNIVSQTAANTIAINDAATATITTINVTGASNLTLTEGATNADDAVTTINASAFTGALKVTTGSAAQDMSITGGSGNDTVTLSGNTFSSADSVDGGAGTDTLNVATAITASTDLKNVSNVEVLAITGALNVTLAADVAGLTTIDTTTGSTASTVTFSSGYTAATTVKADATDVIDNSGANAAIAVNFSSDDAVTVTGGTGTDTLNITASSSAVTFDAKITVVDTVTIVDNGDAASGTSVAGEDVTLTLGTYATALTIDASALDAGTLDSDGAMNADWENLTVTGASATKVLNITGGAGADTITGGTLNDIINGGSGNDSINGSAGGADSISGGDGNDTINMVDQLTSADTIDGGAGTDTLSVTSLSASGLTNVTNVEILSLSGAASSATLTANLSFTTIDMRTVDDTAQVLTLSTGYTNATTVSVDAGDKVVNSANVTLGVTANAADLQSADGTTITGGTGTDTMTIKADSTTANIVATSGLITLVDAIVVTDGGDVTSGSVTAGKDITIDLASYNTALSIDASALDGGTVISDVMTHDEVLTITGTASKALTVTGGGGADVIIGSTANDSLTGGAGNDTFTMSTNLTYQDTIAGGDGTDTITVGAITDVAFMNVTGVETVTLASTATLGTYFDASGATKVNLHTTASAVDASTTSTGHNFVAKASSGTAVNNDLTGGMGNDTFTFGDGGTTMDDLDTDDTIDGGDGTDTIAISNALASVTAVLDLDDVTNVETIQLGTASGLASSSTETIALTVEAIALTTAQTITIDASVITDADDTVAITNSAGTSTHATKFNITGGAGNDTLAGSYLADTIAGGAGDDSITGNLGADSMTGGEGADTFVFAATNGGTNDSKSSAADTVADFVSGTDQFALAINGGGAAAGNVEYLGEFASNIDALGSLSSKVGEYFFNTTTGQFVMDIDGNGLIQADDLAITMTGITKINAGDVAIALTNVTAQTIVGSAGDDTFNFAGHTDIAASTLDGLAGTDTINVTSAAVDIVDADFDGFTNMETLKLTGISTIVVGTNADTAGLATGHGTIVTGAGATQITANNSKHFTVNAAAIVDGTTLTLLDGATSNFVVTGLIGDITASTVLGTVGITTGTVATVGITTGVGATTVAGTATAASINATELADGAALTLSGATNYAVTGLQGNLSSTSTGDLSVVLVDVATATVAFGTSTAGAHSVDADAMTDGDVLTLTGSDAATVALDDADLVAGAYVGNLTVVGDPAGAAQVIATGDGADTITGGAAADSITAGAGADYVVWIGTDKGTIATETGATAGTDNDFAAGTVGDKVVGFVSVSDKLSFAAAGLTNAGATTTDTLLTIAAAGVVTDTARYVEVTTAAGDGTMGAAITLLHGLDTSAVNIGDSFIAFINDGTDGYLYYVEQASAADTIAAADVTLIGQVTLVTNVANGDFVSF